MVSKKIIAVVAGLSALTIVSGSFTAYAKSKASNNMDYSYTTGYTKGVQYADEDEQTDKSDYSYVTGQTNETQQTETEVATDDDKTDFSFNIGKENGTQYADEDEQTDKSDYSYVTVQSGITQSINDDSSTDDNDSFNTNKKNSTQYANKDKQTSKMSYSYVTDQAGSEQYTDVKSTKENDTQDSTETISEESTAKTDYSFNAGQQDAQSRNETYTSLPEGGTKEDAQTFYEQNDVGGGAWVDGTYDESGKTDYSYAKGQQKSSSYAQESGSEETIDKSDYSYSTGRQSYEQNHSTWTWDE